MFARVSGSDVVNREKCPLTRPTIAVRACGEGALGPICDSVALVHLPLRDSEGFARARQKQAGGSGTSSSLSTSSSSPRSAVDRPRPYLAACEGRGTEAAHRSTDTDESKLSPLLIQ